MMVWPPLTADAESVEHGFFTLVERDDGTRQWTYRAVPSTGTSATASAPTRRAMVSVAPGTRCSNERRDRGGGLHAEQAQELLRTNFAPWVQDLGLVVESCEREASWCACRGPRLARFGNTDERTGDACAGRSHDRYRHLRGPRRVSQHDDRDQTMNFMRAIPEATCASKPAFASSAAAWSSRKPLSSPGAESRFAQAVATWALIA
jgi:hypothetical protein